MSVMGPDGKIHQADGSWWSPYGNTDEEIQENLKTGKMPNAPDAMRVGPSRYFTGTKEGDRQLVRFLGRHKRSRWSSARNLPEKKEE